MLFTPLEMETICIFHAGTLSDTLANLKHIVSGIQFPERKASTESAINKLESLSAGDTVSLAFDPK